VNFARPSWLKIRTMHHENTKDTKKEQVESCSLNADQHSPGRPPPLTDFDNEREYSQEVT
jgi:hypothetical protein